MTCLRDPATLFTLGNSVPLLLLSCPLKIKKERATVVISRLC